MKPGQILQNKYRIDGELTSKGGFGIVYKGTDLESGALIAVKEIKPRQSKENKDTEATFDPAGDLKREKEAFLEEAQILERLKDIPQVVKLYGYGDEGDTAYIVEELLQGGTVRKRLTKDEKIPPEEAYRIITELLTILEKVHRRYVIHRDIAPDNIYLLTSGRVKLFDFGVSVVFGKNRQKKEWIPAKKKGYSPLEQLQKSREQGPWTDVYAAAATYYEMLTGKKPPGAEERKIKDELLPPTRAGAAITAEEEQVILAALAVDASRRTRTAEDFLAGLRKAHDGTKKRRKGTGLAAAAAVAVLIGGAVLFVSGGTKAGDAGTAVPEGERIAELSLNAADEKMPADSFSKESGGYEGEPSGEELSLAESVSVPDVTGMEKSEAAELLEKCGLMYSITAEVSLTVPQGTILRQEPAAGTETDPDTVIKIVISLGSAEEETTALPITTMAPRTTAAPAATAAPGRNNNSSNTAPPATTAAPANEEPPVIDDNTGG